MTPDGACRAGTWRGSAMIVGSYGSDPGRGKMNEDRFDVTYTKKYKKVGSNDKGALTE